VIAVTQPDSVISETGTAIKIPKNHAHSLAQMVHIIFDRGGEIQRLAFG